MAKVELILKRRKPILVYDVLEGEKTIYKCVYASSGNAARLEIFLEKPPSKITISW